MVAPRQSRTFRTNQDESGRPLSPSERERLVKPYLPPEPVQQTGTGKVAGVRFHHKQRVRPALKQLLYALIYTLFHALFSIYIRVRQVYHAIYDRLLAVSYYHHRTPELIKRDVKTLSKLPRHLSVILELPADGGKKDQLEAVLNDASEIAAWSACAGIPMLSIYERSGVLKASLPPLHRRIERTLNSYFGTTSTSKPTFSLRAPHLPSFSPPPTPEPVINGTPTRAPAPMHLTVLLISEVDGCQTLVDLTKTLAEMSQQGKLSPADISAELIDAEISESVMGEPDLLLCPGARVVLHGYPPWQVRLTEIFHVQDNVGGIGYQVFLRALYRYAKAEMRFGR